jgi:membrane fusion protein, copper/silver efflux system
MKKQRFLFAMGLILIAGILLYVGATGAGKARKNNAGPPHAHSEKAAGSGASSTDDSGTQMNEAAEEAPLVEIQPDKQQLIGVKLIEAAFKPLSKTIRTVGRVESDERKITTVNLKVEGWIEKLYADYSGKYVKKGDPIADIYSPELLSTQLEFINLLKWKDEKGGQKIQRNIEFNWGDRYGTTAAMVSFDLDAVMKVAKQKLMLWEIPEEQIKQIEETKEPVKTFTVVSPVSGYIIQKPVVKGTRVTPGDKIVDVLDLSSVWIVADIFEPDLPLIKVGQAAKISLSYFPDKAFSAKIDFIYPFVAEETRSVKVRFSVPNRQMLLKPQMFTTVEIAVDMGKRLAIPDSAVLDSGKRQLVYVDKGNGYFEPRVIATGLRADGMVEVLRGLKPGERVAASAAFLIDSEAKLRGIVQE